MWLNHVVVAKKWFFPVIDSINSSALSLKFKSGAYSCVSVPKFPCNMYAMGIVPSEVQA